MKNVEEKAASMSQQLGERCDQLIKDMWIGSPDAQRLFRLAFLEGAKAALILTLKEIQ